MGEVKAFRVADGLPPRDVHPYYGTDYSVPVITNLTKEHKVLFRYDFRGLGWVVANLPEGPSKDDYAHMGLDRISTWMPIPDFE